MFDANALRLWHIRRLLSGLCCKSSILHCPACDSPVVPDVQSTLVLQEIDRGFVPFHRGCRISPRYLAYKAHWKNEGRKHQRALEAQQRVEMYRDWVEGTTVFYDELSHCPNCDLPFNWDGVSAQAQFESGAVPGHPNCSTKHHPLTPAEQRRELRRLDKIRKAS